MSKETITERYLFRGAFTPPLVASAGTNPWCYKVTKTAGSPAVVGVAGVLAHTLDSTAEVQVAKSYHGDVLSYAIGKLKRVRIWASMTASSFTPITAFLGLAAAANDTLSSIAEYAVFKVTASSSLVIDTKDSVVTNTGISTGSIAWSGGTVKEFVIDFSHGTSDVRFYCDNADGDLRPVASKKVFDMSNYTGSLQPYVQVQKSSNAATATLNLVRVDLELNQN